MHAPSTTLRTARTAWPRLSARGLLDILTAAEARYRQRIDLKALDDRMLRDIGITRADVNHELHRPFPW